MIKTKNIFLVNNEINFANTFTTPGSWKVTYFYFTATTTTFTTVWFWQKNILTSTTFIFQLNARLLPPLPCHDQDNYFFISLLRSYIMIERKIINLVTTLLHHNLRVKKYLFWFSHYTTFTTSWLREKTFFILALRSIHHGCRKRNLIFIEPLLWLCYDH